MAAPASPALKDQVRSIPMPDTSHWHSTAKQPADSFDMSVNDDSAGDSVPGAKYDIRGLPADTRQAGHLFERLRQLSIEVGDQLLRHTTDVLSLRSEETQWANDLLNVFLPGICQVLRRGILLKERWCRRVDAFVGALS